MKNGIYTRREIRIISYEKDGTEPFVVVAHDKCTDYPIVLSGPNAEKLIQAIADCLEVDDKEKGS